MSKTPDFENDDEPIIDVRSILRHIKSLGGIATIEQIGNKKVATLLKMGYIEKAWIGNYSLTDKGENEARK